MRKIENSDIWAAARGLRMFSSAPSELHALVRQHAQNELFASQVIAEAARQALAVKRGDGRGAGVLMSPGREGFALCATAIARRRAAMLPSQEKQARDAIAKATGQQ